MLNLRKYTWPLMVLVLGLSLSTFISWKLYERNVEVARGDFERMARKDFLSIKDVVDWHGDTLNNLSVFFLSLSSLEEREHNIFANQILKSHVSFDEIGWVERIRGKSNVDLAFSRLRKDYPDLKVPERNKTEIYNFLAHIEPHEQFHNLLGTDASADAEFSEMMRISEQKDGVSMFLKSLPIMGLKDIHRYEEAQWYDVRDEHIIMLKPAFDDDKKTIKGFVFSVVDIKKLLNDFVYGKSGESSFFNVRIEKELSTGERRVLFVTDKTLLEKEALKSPFQYEQAIILNNSKIILSFSPREGFFQARKDYSTIILLVCLYAFSCLISGYVYARNKDNDKISPKRAFFIGFVIFIAVISSSYVLYYSAIMAVEEDVKTGSDRLLVGLADIIAKNIDGDVHPRFTSRDQEKSPEYLEQIAKMSIVQEAFEEINYIYTIIMKEGDVYFVLDPTPPGIFEDGVETKSHIMDKYDEAKDNLDLLSVFKTKKTVLANRTQIVGGALSPFTHRSLTVRVSLPELLVLM